MPQDEDWLRQAAAEAWQVAIQETAQAVDWPSEYTNAETHKQYQPHHDQERRFVFDDIPRYALAKGGEGGGKSVAGIVKNLNRLRRGMSGIMVSPDFEHFKRSLWPEFRRWCPWPCVVEKDRYRQSAEWEASKPFQLHFNSEVEDVTAVSYSYPKTPTHWSKFIATLYCGGIEDPNGWEGPNVSFAHFDEGRRHKTPEALKVLDGRVRILGPHNEPPQLYITTTPRKHWLFDYFGPIDCHCENCNEDFKGQTALPIVEFFKYICPKCGNHSLKSDDKRLAFKSDSLVVDLLTSDNERMGNLAAGYTTQRRQSLTEAEARVLLGAEWEDIDDNDRFMPSMALWDACLDPSLPPLTEHEQMIIALDGADVNDSFGLVGVTSHPTRPGCLAARVIYEWTPPKEGGVIDHYGDESNPGPDWILRHVLCPRYAVNEVVFDPHGIYQLTSGLMRDGVVACVEFSQRDPRLEADKMLFDLIASRRLLHDGNPALRRHIDNADRKPDPESRKLRIVKREANAKIDLAVCLSMACYTAVQLGM